MSEEKDMQTDERELVAEEAVAEVAEELVTEPEADLPEAEEAVSEAVEETVPEPIEEATVADETADERVEAAVRNIEQEAAEQQAAEEQAEAGARKKRERRSKQARAAKDASDEAPAAAVRPTPVKVGGLAALSTTAWIGIAAACLALGLVLGRFVLGGSGGAHITPTGTATVAEKDLDSTYATYTYNGKTETVTVREALDQVGGAESALQEDGTYAIPSAEAALSAARNAILMQEADARDITVSDEDLAAFAEQALGTSDYDAIASTYGMDAEEVKTLLMESARMSALRDAVVGEDAPEMPESPDECEEGKEDEATKEYAKYIIALAGEEWDADKDTWAAADGPYATALADYEVSKKGASYNAAQAAYFVAYQQYSEVESELSDKWTEYVNGMLGGASIQIASLAS